MNAEDWLLVGGCFAFAVCLSIWLLIDYIRHPDRWMNDLEDWVEYR